MNYTLNPLNEDEVSDAPRFVDVIERAGHMHAEQADEWRRRIGAKSTFRLAVE
jgi:hypothetical protein